MTKGLAGLAVTVIIQTHNPRMDCLARVIDALRQQTLSREGWELVVADNNSQPELRASIRHTA
jgi:glycosyltransferase involved in cell wall biosynthesis